MTSAHIPSARLRARSSFVTALAVAGLVARAGGAQSAATAPTELATVSMRGMPAMPVIARPLDTAAITRAIRVYRSGAGHPPPVLTIGIATVFPFGHLVPLLTCPVLRACVIELEPGETLVEEPIAGDQGPHGRWIITRARAGPRGNDVLVVVKPTACDLATNLTLSTDRRLYDLDLASPACPERSPHTPPYQRHIRFYYPDAAGAPPTASSPDTMRAESPPTLRTATPLESARGTPRPRDSTADRMRDTTPPVGRYRIVRARRGPFGLFGHRPLDFPWQPTAITDDGQHVVITMPPEAHRYPAPLLYALEDDDSHSVVNYTLRDTLIVTDRLIRRGVLVLTSGAREHRLTFENRAWGASGPSSPPRAGRPD